MLWAVGGLAVGAALLLGVALAAAVKLADHCRNRPVFKQALAQASDHPRVIAALGSPIDTGFGVGQLIDGGYHWSLSIDSSTKTTADPTGERTTTRQTERYTAPIRGPRGRGRLHVEAENTGAGWTFLKLDAEIDGRTVHLTTPPGL